MVLVCQVISQEHAIKWSFDFMGENPLWWVTTLPSLVVIGCCSGDKFFLNLLCEFARPRDSRAITCYR